MPRLELNENMINVTYAPFTDRLVNFNGCVSTIRDQIVQMIMTRGDVVTYDSLVLR